MYQKKYADSFEDLEVFQKAYGLSLEIHRTLHNFPKYKEASLIDQMQRASRSICANIAEGFSRQRHSPRDFKRFLVIAVGSAGEMRLWLKYCLDLWYIHQDTYNVWQGTYHEIIKMLHGLVKKIEI